MEYLALGFEFSPPWLGKTTIQIPWIEGVHMTNLRRSTDSPERNEISSVFMAVFSLLLWCVISEPTFERSCFYEIAIRMENISVCFHTYTDVKSDIRQAHIGVHFQ